MDSTITYNNALNDIIPLKHAKTFINSVDLTLVTGRLVYVDGWSRKSAVLAVQQYRNFLYLKKKYGDRYPLPPSYEIDEAWHAHILFTEFYAEFCRKFFGQFLHHRPHLGGDADSYENLVHLFKETQNLYQKEFGCYIHAIKKRPIMSFLSQIWCKPLDPNAFNK